MASPISLKRPSDHVEEERDGGGDVNTPAPSATSSEKPLSKRQKSIAAAQEIKRLEKEIKDRQIVEEKAKTNGEKVHTESDSTITDAMSMASPDLLKLPSDHVEVERDGGGDVNTPAPSATSSEKPLSKRQKSVAAAQETKRQEKEIKDRQRAEEKAKRNGEKEEKRKVREAQSKAKEEERNQREKVREAQLKAKEDERRKKEKSQLRLNSFFVQNATAGSPSLKGQNSRTERRNPISSINEGEHPKSRSASPKPQDPQPSEYERLFKPFFWHLHTIPAPGSRMLRDRDGLKHAQINIDEQLNASEDAKLSIRPFDSLESLHIHTHKNLSRGIQHNAVKDLLARIHGTCQNPIDLTGLGSGAVDKATALLTAIPVKYLKFAEDVRPPYVGTYTKVLDLRARSKLRRNPFKRILPMDYDYDSEAEWEEPGEGEDLDSEGEEEVGDDEEEDEMKGFLDDEEAGDAQRRLVTGDLQPLSTGICWENSQHAHHSNNQDQGLDLQFFRLEMICGERGNPSHAEKFLTVLETFKLPIDPYSTVYWQTRSQISQAQSACHTTMDPPRAPLTNISRSNNLRTIPSTAEALKAPFATTEISMPPNPSKAPKRLIGPDAFDDFKKAVAGSDLTKTGLVEILKKQFPKQSKDAIKDTLGLIAERVGGREAEKRWVLKASYSMASS
ncbi:hypothetical protein MMC07_005641 [Pseudocyphellaria aurata]|nr:hypothetical protein [Pseudocyphellaria aurata]